MQYHSPPSCRRLSLLIPHCGHRTSLRRHTTTQTTPISPKPTGDISSVFPSLSGTPPPSLPPRFATLKTRLTAGHGDALQASWRELLSVLKTETEEIELVGSRVIPEIEYGDIGNLDKRTRFRDELKKKGVAIVRSVVSESEALGWKELLQRYIKTNPQVRGRNMMIAQGMHLKLLEPCSPSIDSFVLSFLITLCQLRHFLFLSLSMPLVIKVSRIFLNLIKSSRHYQKQSHRLRTLLVSLPDPRSRPSQSPSYPSISNVTLAFEGQIFFDLYFPSHSLCRPPPYPAIW